MSHNTSRCVALPVVCFFLILLSVLLISPRAWSTNVNVDITCDNGYSFAYGSATAIAQTYGNLCNTSPSNIFGCGSGGVEHYSIDVSSGAYLYIIGWADNGGTQGVIAQFKVGTTAVVYTGVGPWEVYATGVSMDCGDTPPTISQINAQLAIANAGTGGANTSVGWVGTTPVSGYSGVLAIGQDNTSSDVFPAISCLDGAARWMWYQTTAVADAFHYNPNNDREYLIFRIPADVLLACEPVNAVEVASGWDQLHGTLLSSIDSEWMVVADDDPSTSEPRPAYVIPQYASWAPPESGSQWISPYESVNATSGNLTYSLEYKFCLQTTTSAALNLWVRADNIANVYLNGNQIGTTTNSFQPGPAYHISTSSFFINGTNVLKVVLTNQASVLGLDVSGLVQGNLVKTGYCCSGANNIVMGKVWYDFDQDGVKDASESILPGWTVNLSSGATTSSDGHGNYYFTGLSEGTYAVSEFLQPGWHRTFPISGVHTFNLYRGEVARGDFGNEGSCTNTSMTRMHVYTPQSTAAGDTTVLLLSRFNTGSNCNVQGWTSVDLSGRGDFAGLFKSGVLQEDPCVSSLSCLWAFINTSTESYACNAPPSPAQMVVPRHDAQQRYVRNEIWSPSIPIGSGCQNLGFQFSVYRDLSYQNLVFYTWHVRSKVGGNWGPWRDKNLVYYGHLKEWITHLEVLGPLVDSGATDIQVALGVRDMCDAWCGTIGTDVCHSHAPLFDNVKVFRVALQGPQWIIHDMNQFQDNFPENGTITGCVRADMAADITPVSSTTSIVPGDSAVVMVGDCQSGIGTDPGTGGPAVYLYVSVQNGNGPAKSGPALTDNPARYPWVGSTTLAYRTWDRIRLDDGCKPGEYCVDLNDCYFTPGDTVLFFYGAENGLGLETFAYGAHLNLTGVDPVAAALDAAEFTCLPTLCASGCGDILYVDGTDGIPGQEYFDSSFRSIGLTGKVDRFDVRAPSSAVGNRLGSRVKNVNQLLARYRKIIWDCGTLEVTVGDGSGTPEKSPDLCLLSEFVSGLTLPGGVFLAGDNVPAFIAGSQIACANDFRNAFIPFNIGSGNHRLAPTNYPVSPKLYAWPGRCFDDDWVAFGGCPGLDAFDVMTAQGTSKVEMSYGSTSGANGAVISNFTGNGGVILSGISFSHIRDDELDGVWDRNLFLYKIITCLGNLVTYPVGAGPAFRNELSQNHPNPFNPTTMIAFSIRQRGQVTLKVYDVSGALVRTLVDENRPAGSHEVPWDGRDTRGQGVASGVYFYRLEAPGFTKTRKMVLLK